MAERVLALVSDIHYAGPAEQARGDDYELKGIGNPLLRLALGLYRRHIWLQFPLRQNYLYEAFLKRTAGIDTAIANGDYSCDTGAIGVCDPAARESAAECIRLFRGQFPTARLTFGDHELGKASFAGDRGGLRLASWRACLESLKLEPVWTLNLGRYRLIGVVSSLVALPVFELETLPEERQEWAALRAAHMEQIRRAFGAVRPEEKILLFVHDPTALPFLAEEPEVRSRFGQLEQTIIGHLHSQLILKQAWLLAGIPRLTWCGATARRLSTALGKARTWQPFRLKLCPSLAGLELLKDGGFYTVHLDPDGGSPVRFRFHKIAR